MSRYGRRRWRSSSRTYATYQAASEPVPTVPPQSARIVEHASWSAFLDAARAFPDYPCPSNFAGVDSIAEAIELGEHGWPEGMRYVRDVALPALDKLIVREAHPDTWSWDVTGAAYEVGEYLSGVPECWLASALAETKPTVTIMMDITVSGVMSPDGVARRGGAVTALVMALQAVGYPVRLYAVSGLRPSNDRDVWQRIPLTDDNGGPLDTDRLLFALAHRGCTRGLCFAIVERNDFRGDLCWPSSSCPWKDEADLFLGRGHISEADWENPEQITTWLTGTFERLTGKGGQS